MALSHSRNRLLSKPLKVLHVAPEQAFYKRFKKAIQSQLSHN